MLINTEPDEPNEIFKRNNQKMIKILENKCKKISVDYENEHSQLARITKKHDKISNKLLEQKQINNDLN